MSDERIIPAEELDNIRARAKDYRRRFEAGEVTTLAYDITGIDIPRLLSHIAAQEAVIEHIQSDKEHFKHTYHSRLYRRNRHIKMLQSEMARIRTERDAALASPAAREGVGDDDTR